MNRPTDYEILRDALMAAAASAPTEPAAETLKTAEIFADWLRKGVTTHHGEACDEACDEPLTSVTARDVPTTGAYTRVTPVILGAPIEEVAVMGETAFGEYVQEIRDVWEEGGYCTGCGHLWSVHSLGVCMAILGKKSCDCTREKHMEASKG